MAGADPEISYTARFDSEPIIPLDPVSFGSSDTYVAQGLTHTSKLTTFYVKIKTYESNGLILFRGGQNGDYFALGLVQVTNLIAQLAIMLACRDKPVGVVFLLVLMTDCVLPLLPFVIGQLQKGF